jgi:hypothetical protein
MSGYCDDGKHLGILLHPHDIRDVGVEIILPSGLNDYHVLILGCNVRLLKVVGRPYPEIRKRRKKGGNSGVPVEVNPMRNGTIMIRK